MKLIALCGAAGAGKDTVADMLPARKLAFADTLYCEVADAFGVSVERLQRRDTKERPSGLLGIDCCEDENFCRFAAGTDPDICDIDEWSAKPRSPRQILQWWGDYRRAQDPGYFVDAAFVDTCTVMQIDGESVVITDVRFPNEAAMVRQLGGQIWQIKRPGYEAGGTGHASDTAGDEFAPDRVLLNSGSLEELRATVLAAWEGV